MSIKKDVFRPGLELEKILSREELAGVVKRLLKVEIKDDVLRYYDAAVHAVSLAEHLAVVSLIKDIIDGIYANVSNEKLQQLNEKITDYHLRLTTTVDLLRPVKAVPRKLHFVWVGGGIGAIQGDYINVWKQMTAADGYRLNLWYDSDALLAHETNRIIVESAKASAGMVMVQQGIGKPAALADLYVERAVALRQQMFEHIQDVTATGGSADQARIDLLVRAYGQDEQALNELKARNLRSFETIVRNGVQLRDIRSQLSAQPLFDIYEREISFRGNLAAASDITRLQAVNLEGGTYLDADLLPSLHKNLGGVDIATFSTEERMGVTQLLLDNNPQVLPGRGSKYADLRDKVPGQHRQALLDFAKSVTSINDIFATFNDVQVSGSGLRVGNKNSSLASSSSKIPFNGLSNALLSGHPGSAALHAVIEKVRSNYALRDQVLEQVRTIPGPSQVRRDFPDVVIAVLEQEYGAISTWGAKLVALNQLVQAMVHYDADGIKFGAQSAIAMSGPTAVSTGLDDFVSDKGIGGARQLISDGVDLFDGFNLATEEETHHSWKDNAKTELAWFEQETQRIKESDYKVSHKGDVENLLKTRYLTFDRGWPVIEGRTVLLTDILQPLIDRHGEAVVHSMRNKISGVVELAEPLKLTFEERQRIVAQPDSALPVSIGAESVANLNELFARLQHGSLAVDHLSPLQRVVLGGLFGAERLDAPGFGIAWQAALNYARETAVGGVFARFAALETLLQKSAAPAFIAGLAEAGSPGQRTTRELKALALIEPMTLRQWGERIGQIHSTAQREYRTQILTRGAPARDRFFQAGAVSARQMPQDFLLQAPGDPGRRCYPLALLMATALGNGEAAERTLIGRMANANLAPQDAESRAFTAALDELRGVAMADVGTPFGTQDLNLIVQTLEAKTTSSVLLLDTGNHALLLAKVVNGDSSVYRFFDPNFAVYGFTEAVALRQGIDSFLASDSGALATLYGLSDIGNPAFNVVELNTSVIADSVLPSRLRIGNLLEGAPIAGQSGSVLEKHSVLRARSLSENARMGASLAQLDGRYWSREIDRATTDLRATHQLSRAYMPLLETVERSAGGDFTLTMVDAKNPQNTRTFTTADPRFIKVKKYVQDLVQTLAGKDTGPSDADGGSRLSFAFGIQTLITEMRRREQQADGEQVPALSVALQVQVYVSYAQLTFGVVNDTVQMIDLVRRVAASEQALATRQASLSGRLLGRVSTGAGIGFSLVNIGFDIYGLTTATNQEQRSRLTTQLVFDVAALGLDITALAIGGTVGAAAAILSVPLLGVGIGVSAIAGNLGQINDKARVVGRHLRKIQLAYARTGYTIKEGVLTFEAEAVITELDFTKNRIQFDSQKLFPMVRGGLGLPDYLTHPKDLHRSINIRQALDLPQAISLDRAPFGISAVVLPRTPVCYYGYEYQLGSAGFDPDEEDEADLYRLDETLKAKFDDPFLIFNPLMTDYPNLPNRTKEKLEFDADGERRFIFFPNTPIPHMLYKLLPVNKPTKISVTLDEQVRQLVVPPLPDEWKRLISYQITGQSGLYHLTLSAGIDTVQLSRGSESVPVSWLIHASWVGEEQVRFEGAVLFVDGIRIEGFEGFLQLKDGELYQFDPQRNAWVLLSISLDKRVMIHDFDENLPGSIWYETVYLKAVLARVRSFKARLSSAYVPLHNYIIPYNCLIYPVYTTAYYDVALDRLLYARNLPKDASQGAMLSGVHGQHAWFYHPDYLTIWRVDLTTGRVDHRYRPMSPLSGSQIISCTQVGDNKLSVVQQTRNIDSTGYTLHYLIEDKTLTLTSISAYDTFPREDSRDVEYWRQPLSLFQLPSRFAEESPDMTKSFTTWTAAPFVGVRMHVMGESIYSGWIRLRDYKLYANDNGVSEKVMLMWDQPDNDTMLFYDKSLRALIRGFSNAQGADSLLDQVIERDVIEVTAANGRYISTKSNGQMLEVEKDGTLTFIGVGTAWLQSHPDWIAALPEVTRQRGKAPFAIIGLNDFSQNALLAAWSIDAKVLVTDAGRGNELALLSLTPDGLAAWLFDRVAGKLYRQPLREPADLRLAFGNGPRLLDPAHLSGAQQVWSEWTFAEVLADGNGLRGRTRDGVNLELTDARPARIVSVENDWALRPWQTDEQLQARVKTLIAGQAHAPVLQVQNLAERFKYYVPALDRLFDIGGRSDGQWAVFLGTQNGKVPMLFDPVDDLLFARDLHNWIWLKGSHAEREGELLTFETSSAVPDLFALLPDGVSRLVLAFGQKASTYRITERVWQRLDCIVIDRLRASDGTPLTHALFLDMDANEHLQLSLIDGHLSFIDPDTTHSLILRNVIDWSQEATVSLGVTIRIGVQEHQFSIVQLLQAVAQRPQAVTELQKIIENRVN